LAKAILDNPSAIRSAVTRAAASALFAHLVDQAADGLAPE